MTIPTSQSLEIFLGNGVTTSFNFTFVGDSISYIVVTYTDITGNATVLSAASYTVSLNEAATGSLWGIGGTVTYPLVGSPIAAGTTLTVARILPLTQVNTISNQGNFAPQVTESALDTLAMQIQQTSARSGLFRGTWATGITYNFGDYVVDGVNGANTGNYYFCILTNISTVWATDLAAGDWVLAINIQAINNSSPYITLYSYGAHGDGITSDDAALAAAQAVGKPIFITTGTYLLSGSNTVSINMTFVGGRFSIVGGQTLVVNSQIKAPPVQIFSGSGTVTGQQQDYIFPEWWGAVANGLNVSPTDSTAAIQAAFNFTTYRNIQLLGMYAVSGVSTDTKGLNFNSPFCPPSKNDDPVAGLSALGNQAYILRTGDGTSSPQEVAESGFFGMTFDGRSKTITSALHETDTLSQSKVRGVTYRKAYGAGVKAKKLEDVNFLDSQFMYLGYDASGNDTGAIVIDAPLADGVYNNIIRFGSGCRFEFIDGGVIRFANTTTAACGGVFMSQCKIEMGVDGVYGSHAGNYGIIHTIQDSQSYMCTDLYMVDNWIAQIERAACILRLGNFETVIFENNHLSGDGTPVKLFDIETSGSSTVSGKGFVFRKNTYRDFNNTGSMAWTMTYKSTYPCIFEYPTMFGYPGPNLYMAKIDREYDAQEFAHDGILVADPDATDPCISALGVVPSVSGANTAVLLHLGSSSGLPKIAGLQAKSQGLLRLRIRCKKSGNTASAGLDVYSDGGTTFLTTFTVPSFFWQMVEVFVNVKETYNNETGIEIINKSSNNAAHHIYIDRIEVDWVDFTKATSVPSTGTWDLNDKFYYTDPTAGGNVGAVCTTAGTFGTLTSVTANLTSGSNVMTVTSATNLRVGMYITTNAGGITAATILNVNGTSVTVNQNSGSDQTTAVSYATPVFKTFGAIAA